MLKLSSCSSNAGMEILSAPLINAIVNNALVPYTPTHASNRCRLKSFTSCAFRARLAGPDFVMCIEARAVRCPEVWKFYGSLTLLHFPTGGANDAQNVSVDTRHSSRKRYRPAEFIKKNDNVILQGI